MIALERVFDGSPADRNFQALQRLVIDTGGLSMFLRVVAGTVTSGGAIDRGVGFTSSKTGAGRYAVAYNTVFPGLPVILLGWGDTLGGGGAEVSAETTAGFSVVTYNTASAVLDNSFSFLAIYIG